MKTWLAFGLAVLLGAGLGVCKGVVQIRLYPWDAAASCPPESAQAELLANPNASPPKVMVREEVHDFGIMDSNAIGRHEFHFMNIGGTVLKLEPGKSTCKCTASILNKGEVVPGDSGVVTIEWHTPETPGEYMQTAEIRTNDPLRPSVTLTIKGTVVVAARANPMELILTGLTPNQPRSGDVRVYGFLPTPLEIQGHEFSQSDIADRFDLQIKPLTAEQLAEETGASSGYLVTVTTKPGLPVGAFQQRISLKTNYAQAPTIEITVQGNVAGEISLVGTGWNEKKGILTLGSVKSQDGLDREVFIRARGPLADKVQYKLVEVSPDLLQVELGQPKYIEGSNVALTPLKIHIAKGSRPADHLGLRPESLGRIVLQTSDPNCRELRILVRFAVEG